jgi:hypothetical protein
VPVSICSLRCQRLVAYGPTHEHSTILLILLARASSCAQQQESIEEANSGRPQASCWREMEKEEASGRASDPWSASFTVRGVYRAAGPKGLGGVLWRWLHASVLHGSHAMRSSCRSGASRTLASLRRWCTPTARGRHRPLVGKLRVDGMMMMRLPRNASADLC